MSWKEPMAKGSGMGQEVTERGLGMQPQGTGDRVRPRPLDRPILP